MERFIILIIALSDFLIFESVLKIRPSKSRCFALVCPPRNRSSYNVIIIYTEEDYSE